MRSIIIILPVLLLSLYGTELQKADFETDGENYGISGGGTSGTTDYLVRTLNGDGSATHADMTGIQGAYYLGGRDIRGVSGFDTPAVLTVNQANISGSTGINVKFLLAANSLNEYESISSGFGSDYIYAEYSLDGGTWTKFAQFTGASSAGEARLSEDTDFNGTGDGTAAGTSFTEFTYTIPGTGSTLDLRFVMYTGSGQEFIAVDNIRINDDTVVAVPQNLITVNATATTLDISWDPVSGAAGYRIYRSTQPYSGFSLLDTSTTEGYTDTGVYSGKRYFYYVTAYTSK